MTLSYYMILTVVLVLPPKDYQYHYKNQSHPSNSMQYGHEQWDALLRKHVTPSGDVHYADFREDIELLQEYLATLSGKVPGENAPREEKLVYYINLYNAATVKLILDHYPVKSIKEIKNPWDKKWIKVGDKLTSLGAIEHKILRKLDEPRIHFAINCASYSCPQLQNRAFTIKKLEVQLEKATAAFINDPSKNRISTTNAELSKIFKWYKSDFTKKGSLVDYINIYSDTPVYSGVKLSYIEYDWSLNEAK